MEKVIAPMFVISFLYKHPLTMKTTLFILVSSITLFITACTSEQELAQPTSTAAFTYELHSESCEEGGSKFWIDLQNRSAYSLLWEMDGGAQGHYQETNCLCGDSITVHVTRLEDGMRVSQSSAIPTCK